MVNCDNNGGSDNRDSALSVPVEAGVTNFIMIDGVNGQTGTLKLNYSLVITSELTFLGTTIEGYPQMRIEGRTDLRFALEVSTNMVTWTRLLTNNSPGGTLEFSDTVTAPGTQRFYRAVMLP
jgi:hypothetical protein